MLTVDSVLSGTYQTACVAARQVMDDIKGADIRVIDSKTAACPISGIAMEVLKHTAAGMDIDEAEKWRVRWLRVQKHFQCKYIRLFAKGWTHWRSWRFDRKYFWYSPYCALR